MYYLMDNLGIKLNVFFNLSYKFLSSREQFPNEKVPMLEEAVQLCLELGLKMYLDIKGSARLVSTKYKEALVRNS